MGAINLHNRDRYYYNFGTSIYDPAQQDFTKYGAWGAPFHGPNSRGPVEVDTVHPITIRRNRLEVRQHVGLVGEPGEWWGRQNTLCVLDIDDGNGRYQIEENLLLATGTNGLKLGHIVDDITVTNNIVIARQGPPSVDLEVNDRQDLHAFNIGPQCLENTMNASNNIIVNLDGGTMLASTYGNYAGYSGCGNMSDAQCYLYLKPKISTMDRNVYWSKGGSVRMLPNQTAAQELLGLDVHSLIGVDPMLDLSDLTKVHVIRGSPALALGFVNFPYGPRSPPLTDQFFFGGDGF